MRADGTSLDQPRGANAEQQRAQVEREGARGRPQGGTEVVERRHRSPSGGRRRQRREAPEAPERQPREQTRGGRRRGRERERGPGGGRPGERDEEAVLEEILEEQLHVGREENDEPQVEEAGEVRLRLALVREQGRLRAHVHRPARREQERVEGRLALRARVASREAPARGPLRRRGGGGGDGGGGGGHGRRGEGTGRRRQQRLARGLRARSKEAVDPLASLGEGGAGEAEECARAWAVVRLERVVEVEGEDVVLLPTRSPKQRPRVGGSRLLDALVHQHHVGHRQRATGRLAVALAEVVDQRLALEHKVAARPAGGASGEDPGACAGRELVEPAALLRRLQRRQRRLELRHPRPQRPLANTTTSSSSTSVSSASGRRLDGRRRADRHAAAEGTGGSSEASVACARARLAGEDRRRMTAPRAARDLVDSVNVS
mmetsp:Transcript_11586/g.37018  ORF Transcript_11586/g.37018 Transcript_11586/m.37018 type:complete len:433 (+) Transcript_11586:1316-2614(+)